MSKATAALRRIQGELILLEKQQAHFVSVLSEFQNYVSLLLYPSRVCSSCSSVRSGALIRPDCNMLEVENKACALQCRAYDVSRDVTATCTAVNKLLTEVGVQDEGLKNISREASRMLLMRKDLCEQALMATVKTEDLTTFIILLRNATPLDLDPLLDFFGITSK